MRSPWRRTGSAPCTLRLNLQPLAAPAKGGKPNCAAGGISRRRSTPARTQFEPD